jgi:hypothetical protein
VRFSSFSTRGVQKHHKKLRGFFSIWGSACCGAGQGLSPLLG